MGEKEEGWWTSPRLAAALALLCAVPLLWPSIPPLTDLPGHMGRYRVAMDLGTSPYLSRYFGFRWVAVGNLGVDVPAVLLGRLIGLEAAVKLIVMAIPAAMAAGMLLLAREVHGRVPPTALFALPLVYAYPFQFGFVNFCLGVALAFLAAGLWLRLERKGRLRIRALLFVPIGFLVWLSHSVAWGMLGLILLGIEIGRARKDALGWIASLRRAGLAVLPLAPPVAAMAYWWFYGSSGENGNWNAGAKLSHLIGILRNEWMAFDTFASVLLGALLLLGARRIGLSFEPRLGWAAFLLLIAFLAMPGLMMGAHYADMRLAPYVVAAGILALSPTGGRRAAAVLAVAGLVFLGARLAAQGWTYWKLHDFHQAQLRALDHVPAGARIFAKANVGCSWSSGRVDHLGSMMIVRRHGFANGQWPMPGGHLMSIHYPPGGGFALDETQFYKPEQCRNDELFGIEPALAMLPREAFDYVWLLDIEPSVWPRADWLQPVWRSERGVLYRIVRYHPGRTGRRGDDLLRMAP